jgi:hypothetical protein
VTTNGSDGNGGDGNNPPFTPPPPALLVHVIDDDPEMLAGIEIRQQVSPTETVAIGKRLNKAGCMNLVSLVMDAMCRVTIVSNRAGFKAVH